MSENSVLRRTFSLKWEEVTGDWRKLYSNKLHGKVVQWWASWFVLFTEY